MAGHILELRGCTPEPLGNYLKGLGVFRLIAEQADPQARAWWKDGVLHVLQHKWRDEQTANTDLVEWLLKECRFTPLIAPWQKGTGYLPIGKRDKGSGVLLELLKSNSVGTSDFKDFFRVFAESVGVQLPEEINEWFNAIRDADITDSEGQLHQKLRNRMRSQPGLRWLDAVGVLSASSKRDDSPNWFKLLASGGGEKSGKYVVNHQERLKDVLLGDQDLSKSQLNGSLLSLNGISSLAEGLGAMYYPALMKVPNAGQDFLPKPERRVNPWDFILLLEGSLVWSLAVTRRKGVSTDRSSFPFYCRSSFGGSVSVGPKEVEGAQKSIAHGELWCPVWATPTTLEEVNRIFGEGRMQIAGRTCTRSLEFALALTGFGIDRGISAFYRYTLLGRSGSFASQDRTTLLAVANGCFVPQQSATLSFLDELTGFADNIAAYLTDSGQQPRRLMLARIHFERSWFEACTTTIRQSQAPSNQLLELVVNTGRFMRELGTNSAKPGIVKIKKGDQTSERSIPPVGDLHRDWQKLLGHAAASTELSLARAIAGIAAWGAREVQGRKRPVVDALLSNLIPVARPWAKWEWYDPKAHKGFHDSSVWSRGASLTANLSAVLRRRLIDAQRGSADGLPLWSPHGATYADVLAYWNGDLDEGRLAELIHGFALIDSGTWTQNGIDDWQQKRPERCETPDIDTSQIYFVDDIPCGKLRVPTWLELDFDSACELPRVYHLLKLCFVGGRLPRRPVERESARRTGDEPFPPDCLDVLSLLEAGRLTDAVQLAARRLRAKGYPAILRDVDLASLVTNLNCRRLAGMMLIPVRHPGVSAALAIKPESINS